MEFTAFADFCVRVYRFLSGIADWLLYKPFDLSEAVRVAKASGVDLTAGQEAVMKALSGLSLGEMLFSSVITFVFIWKIAKFFFDW